MSPWCPVDLEDHLGNTHPRWPSSSMDLEAEVKRFEAEFAKLAGPLADIEFVDGGLVSSDSQLGPVREKFQNVTGILAVQLTMGVGGRVKSLLETTRPLVLFALPYSGHEWHTVAALKKEGKLIESLPSSDYADLAAAVRPFRAIHRLAEARILHVSQGDADPGYCRAIREKFGSQIISVKLPELERAYQQASENEAQADAVDSPFVDRACRSKVTMRVQNIDRFLENWSCGLHRVIVYGDHTRDVRRFCRFKNIRLLREGEEDLKNVPGLEWETYVHA